MLIYDNSRIRSVTAEGLSYIDNSEQEQFIDFTQCYERYLARNLSPEAWENTKKWNKNWTDADWDRYQERVRKFREIGRRDIINLYIDFHTDPLIRFKFSSEDEWGKIRFQIEDDGWRTFDMT